MTSQELKQKTRFCKDCKFCELGTFGGYEYAECTHAEFQEVFVESQNKITGESKQNHGRGDKRRYIPSFVSSCKVRRRRKLRVLRGRRTIVRFC